MANLVWILAVLAVTAGLLAPSAALAQEADAQPAADAADSAAAAIGEISPTQAQEAATADDATTDDATADDVSLAPDLFERDTFKLTPIVCPFKSDIKYEPEHVSCGLLEVPENREKSRGRTLQLHYVKLHAREPDDWDAEEKGAWEKRDDAVIYLTGGPGARVTGYVPRFVKHGLRDVRDMYILEQRGIGTSQDFCPIYGLVDPAAANKPSFLEAQRAGLAAMETCFKNAKAARVDLSAYNTIENARDVEALRRALGFEQWNVWGISYGSILGQAYLKQDPDGIRSAVLDAIVPIDPEINFQGIGRHFQRSLDILKEACDADATCAKAHPDFIEKLKAAIRSVQETPIEVDALDPEYFPSGKAWFFNQVVGGATFVQLYEQKNYGGLPAFMSAFADATLNRDEKVFKLMTSGMGPGGGFGISQGMYNAIACNDGWVEGYRAAWEKDAADHPELGALNGLPALADDVVAICKRYGMKPRDPAQYAPVETTIPTIVAEGAMDPITPPPFAKAIMPGFVNGTYVEFAFAGHGPTRSVECAGDFLTKFYDDPNAEVDMTCPDSMEAPKFIGEILPTRALAKLGIMASEDEKKVAAPAAWAGLSAIALLIGFFVYTLSPIARLINGNNALPTGGARPLAWVTALLGVVSLGGLGYAAYATSKASQFLLLLGLVGEARYFAGAGIAAGLTGLVLLWLSLRARINEPLPIGTLLGLVLTAFGGIGLASFLIKYGVTPF
ncbi:MAG: alpha/beta fold hydrolase [Pseudomonadota bacterium]